MIKKTWIFIKPCRVDDENLKKWYNYKRIQKVSRECSAKCCFVLNNGYLITKNHCKELTKLQKEKYEDFYRNQSG